MTNIVKQGISINVKLGIAIAGMTLLIVIAVLVGAYSNLYTNQANAIAIERARNISYAEECALMPYKLYAVYTDALINENFLENGNDYARAVNDWKESINRLRDALDSQSDLDLLAISDPIAEDYFSAYTRWVELIREKDTNTIGIIDREFDRQRDEYAGSILKIRENLLNKMDESNRELRKVMNGISLTQILLICIGIVLGLLVYFILRKTVVVPVRRVAALLRNISQGNGDLTQTIIIKSRDEIGVLANSFNLTMGKIRRLVMTIKSQANILSTVGSELAVNMTQTATAVNQINVNIQSIRKQTVNQMASVSETNSTMVQITQNIGKLDNLISEQSANITQSSSAIEQLLANIASVSETLAKNAESVHELSAASDSGRDSLVEVSSQVRDVAKESESLLEISSVIQSIANQTNLLAMNAAIEAAHAGESGRGFSVVADEIRKLAETSGAQAKTVSAVLKRMKESMGTIASSTDKVLIQFDDITRKINSVNEMERSIKNAMEEQNDGSKQILEAVGQLNDITSAVRDGSAEMLAGSTEVMRESENLGRITDEVSGSMNEMAVGIEQITVAINKVNVVSQGNKQGVDTLNREVGVFIIE